MANNWTREQLIVAFNLYCRIPFARAVQTNPDVIHVAKLIGRSPGAVAFKLGNFGSFDPELKKRGIGGLPNTSKLDKEIWDEFNGNWDELVFQSETLIRDFENSISTADRQDELEELPIGTDILRATRARINQRFFRSSVLSNYRERCCITGLSISTLLVASHIVPWSLDIKNRTNPSNGLCLNSLHDKAFDKGLITITPDFKVKISNVVLETQTSEFVQTNFERIDGCEIDLPEKFIPDATFLAYHNESIFLD